MESQALRALAWYGNVKAKFTTHQQVDDAILCVYNLTKKFLCATLLYNICSEPDKKTQTVSLQRDSYNIQMCLISSEISIIFSSATTVTTMNLI